MKKLFVALLVLVTLVSASALSDCVDLASMSYEELIELNRQMIREIMSRPEWKEVRIPAGQWKVGEDIPAGVYSIKPPSANDWAYVYVWEGKPGDYREGYRLSQSIGDDVPEIGKFELFEGNTLDISGPIILGRPFVLEF